MSRRAPRYRYSYGYLRELIRRSLEGCSEFAGRVEVDGKIERVPEGLWHENYWFWMRDLEASDAQSEIPYFLRLLDQREDWQKGSEPRDRMLREAKTLQTLVHCDFEHPTPEFVCFVHDGDSEPIGMIETALPGSSMQNFKDRKTLSRVSRAAANVHRLALDKFFHLPCERRSEDVKKQIAELEDPVVAEYPIVEEVCQWLASQLDDDDRVCVLHGDLLPQNLLYYWPMDDSIEEQIAVIDWEMACLGDPAYDLAIVSRGNRKVLGVTEGLKVLLEEYLACGGQPITITDVRVHELLLILHWLKEAWHEYQKPEKCGHGPDYYVMQLQSLFRRTTG